MSDQKTSLEDEFTFEIEESSQSVTAEPVRPEPRLDCDSATDAATPEIDLEDDLVLTVPEEPAPPSATVETASTAEPAIESQPPVQSDAPLASQRRSKTVIPLNEEPEVITTAAPSAPKENAISKLRSSLGQYLAIGLGTAATVWGTNYFLLGPSAEDEEKLQVYIETVAKTAAASQAAVKQEPVKIEPEILSEAQISTPELSLKLQITSQGNAVKLVGLELTTPAPPELTPEQVVHGAVRGPWLYKLAFESGQVDQDEQGQFTVHGSAKATIDYQEIRHRFTADTLITGNLDRATNKIVGTLLIVEGYEETPQDQHMHFEAVTDRSFKLYVNMPFEAAVTEATPVNELIQSN